MPDLNMMMREQALSGLQSQLDTAVTNGDTEAARKVSADIAALSVQLAPKAPPFGQADITAELDKHAWFGVDPKKSAKVVELGKTMDPKKFATAAAFAEALVKAVEEDLKPTGAAAGSEEDDEEDDGEEDGEKPAKKPVARRATDGPGEGDATQRTGTRRTAGPWTKLSEAPADVQKEVNRTADKFAPKTKEGREDYVKRALAGHYSAAQLKKGKT